MAFLWSAIQEEPQGAIALVITTTPDYYTERFHFDIMLIQALRW